jgi:four helix bundle protein
MVSRVRFGRAPFSIGANVAEGVEKWGNNDHQRCLQIAAGSASETRLRVVARQDLGNLTRSDSSRIADELKQSRKRLSSLLRK